MLTATEVEAILDAVRREVNEHGTWNEVKDMTVAELCAANRDALVDDLAEVRFHGNHPSGEADLEADIAVYDGMIGN